MVAVPMGKIRGVLLWLFFQQHLPTRNQAAKGFHRQIAFQRYQSHGRGRIPRRSPAYCVNIAATCMFHHGHFAVQFCASNSSVSRRFRQVPHAMAPDSRLPGLTSVIWVFLALRTSLMRKTQNKDENPPYGSPRMSSMILFGPFLTRRLPPTLCSICLCCSGRACRFGRRALIVRWRGGFPQRFFHCDFFVVVILFSLLNTHTLAHAQIPDKAKALAAKFVGTPKNRDDIDDEAEQFRTKSALGGTTLAFAEGVPPTTAPMRMEKTTIVRASLRV